MLQLLRPVREGAAILASQHAFRARGEGLVTLSGSNGVLVIQCPGARDDDLVIWGQSFEEVTSERGYAVDAAAGTITFTVATAVVVRLWWIVIAR